MHFRGIQLKNLVIGFTNIAGSMLILVVVNCKFLRLVKTELTVNNGNFSGNPLKNFRGSQLKWRENSGNFFAR
jgi:hypothetical protein